MERIVRYCHWLFYSLRRQPYVQYVIIARYQTKRPQRVLKDHQTVNKRRIIFALQREMGVLQARFQTVLPLVCHTCVQSQLQLNRTEAFVKEMSMF